MRERITEQLIKRMAANRPRMGNRVAYDSDVIGFGVRVTATGAVAFVLRYVHRGRERRMTLGKHPDLSPSAARDMAIELRGEIVGGRDPLADRRSRLTGPTLSAFCDRYIAEYAEKEKKASSVREDRRLIKRHIRPTLGTLRTVDVSRQDILRLRDDLSRTPYEANRVLALLSKMFNLAELWEIRPDGSNPCRHVKKFPEKRRQGSLSAGELARLGQALVDDRCGAHGSVLNVLRLLLLTGCRVSEIRELQWGWIKWEEAAIHFPDSKTGAKVHRLGNGAIALLKCIRASQQGSNPLVFPGLKDPSVPISMTTVSHTWHRVRTRAGLAGKRIHDFRHTRGSWAASTGANAFLVRDALSHRNVGTTDRYVQFEADPLRQLNDTLDRQIEAALRGETVKMVGARQRSAA
jgi:integrase